MADLSPAAQAVLDALLNAPVNSAQVCNGKAPQIKLAAALRAAADQLSYGHGSWAGTSAIIDENKLLAIAAELDNTSPTH